MQEKELRRALHDIRHEIADKVVEIDHLRDQLKSERAAIKEVLEINADLLKALETLLEADHGTMQFNDFVKKYGFSPAHAKVNASITLLKATGG